MPNDPILHLLGLARKAGRLEIGEEPVGAVCRARQARLVLLASDAAPNTCRRAAHFGEAGNVLWLEVPFTKAELGFALGRGSCAMLALTDAGFAASLTQKLAARDLHELLRCWENYHRLWTVRLHMQHIAFREESRYPGFYYRADFMGLDDSKWKCFVNSKYDPATGETKIFKKPYYQIIPD